MGVGFTITPNTILISGLPPDAKFPAGLEAAWNEERGLWVVRHDETALEKLLQRFEDSIDSYDVELEDILPPPVDWPDDGPIDETAETVPARSGVQQRYTMDASALPGRPLPHPVGSRKAAGLGQDIQSSLKETLQDHLQPIAEELRSLVKALATPQDERDTVVQQLLDALAELERERHQRAELERTCREQQDQITDLLKQLNDSALLPSRITALAKRVSGNSESFCKILDVQKFPDLPLALGERLVQELRPLVGETNTRTLGEFLIQKKAAIKLHLKGDQLALESVYFLNKLRNTRAHPDDEDENFVTAIAIAATLAGAFVWRALSRPDSDPAGE